MIIHLRCAEVGVQLEWLQHVSLNIDSALVRACFFYVRGQEFSCFVGIGMADFVVFVSAHVPLDAGIFAGARFVVGAG